MPPVVIDVRNAEDGRDVVHRAGQALVEGRLVAFPTETVYGLAASALDERAVARLLAAKDRADGHPLTLAIKSADEARDYVPDMCPLAQRLARRCWPGPITLVVDNLHPESLVRRLPSKVRQAVSPKGTIGLRVPGHYVVQYQQVLVMPGHFETQTRQVLVQPGHFETRTVPAVTKMVTKADGSTEVVIVQPAQATQVWIPDRYETQTTQVWVPTQYETRTFRRYVPGQWIY